MNIPVRTTGRWWSEPGSTRRRTVFLSVSALSLLATLYFFREVLLPFFLAILLAYVFMPVVAKIETLRIGRKHIPRWVAVLSLYAVLLSVLAGCVSIAVPRLVVEVQKLASELPKTLAEVKREWAPRAQIWINRTVGPYLPKENTPDGSQNQAADAQEASFHIIQKKSGDYELSLPASGVDVIKTERGFRLVPATHARHSRPRSGDSVLNALNETVRRAVFPAEGQPFTFFRTLRSLIRAVVGGIFTFFITLMLSAYLLITSERIFDFFRSLIRPERQARFTQLLSRMDRGLAGVIRGQLVIALVNGVLSGIGFYLAHLKYWPILTLIATLLSVIPIFGAILSSVPAVIVALQSGFEVAAFVLLWIVGIHQLEANVLNPKIMGDAARVHPVLVVFALLAGEHSFGIVGALLAVPALSIVQTLFLHFRELAMGVSPRRE